MLTSKRHDDILKLLEKNERITTKELSECLSTSPTTIRTDLNYLESLNLIQKFHGGAMLVKKSNSLSELVFSNREQLNHEEKKVITDEALKHIQEGQCIILDASSTSLMLSKKLGQFRKLTVVTNGIYNMLVLKDMPNINIIFIGGVVTKDSGSIEGLLGEDLVKNISADTIFFSAHGLSLSEGATDFNLYEVSLKNLMASRAKKKVALIDSSKIGNTSVASFCKFEQINLLITDQKADKDNLQSFKQHGLAISVV